jgi:hypothetical protein
MSFRHSISQVVKYFRSQVSFVMTDNATQQALNRFLPSGTHRYFAELLSRHPIVVRLSRPRRSKLGDHRAPSCGHAFHRISINDDLNPYAFLTTLLHEIAHATAWEKHRQRVRMIKPHGPEWKKEFEALLAPVVTGGALPVDVANALATLMRNPSATTCSDRSVVLVLNGYDTLNAGEVCVEQLPKGSVFRMNGGKIFRKGRKLRSRYQCREWRTGREYRVHALSRVEPIIGKEKVSELFVS